MFVLVHIKASRVQICNKPVVPCSDRQIPSLDAGTCRANLQEVFPLVPAEISSITAPGKGVDARLETIS